jgi:hypothetical protein
LRRPYTLAERAFWPDKIAGMDALTFFGLFAVSAMLVCYALESRSHWFVMLFAFRAFSDLPTAFLRGLGLLGWSRRSGQPSRCGAGSRAIDIRIYLPVALSAACWRAGEEICRQSGTP